jgi:hypothetical protein
MIPPSLGVFQCSLNPLGAGPDDRRPKRFTAADSTGCVDDRLTIGLRCTCSGSAAGALLKVEMTVRVRQP